MASFRGRLWRKVFGQILDDLISLLLCDVGIFLKHLQHFILPLRLGGAFGHHTFQRMAGRANRHYELFSWPFW